MGKRSDDIIKRYIHLRSRWLDLTDRAETVKGRLDSALEELAVELGSMEKAIDAMIEHDLSSSSLQR